MAHRLLTLVQGRLVVRIGIGQLPRRLHKVPTGGVKRLDAQRLTWPGNRGAA